ncbi:MAG: alpha/beta fold hydrolase [Ruminiclostridium sp.]|nr:alpha/beta fold hydrolase [Ruminiclostridium sp.]
MNKKRRAVIEGNQVSELLTLNLGGYEQKVLIEGKNKELPVVITLHGGPGTPIPFSVGCRGLFPEFTDKFIMVYWDQLGCGINNRKIDESFKISTFVNMTADLIDRIKEKFPENKLILFATSWGSVLSALVSAEKSDAIDGIVVSGQIIKNVFFNDEVVNALEASAAPRKKLEIIKNAKPETANSTELQTISSCLTKYTDAYNNKNCKKAPMGKMIMGLMTSPDYTFMDFKAVVDNGYKGNVSLWNEILKIDLTETLNAVKMPYYIIQGETDIVASTNVVKSVVEKSDNKNLRYAVVENTGHFPGVEMMDKIFESLSELS